MMLVANGEGAPGVSSAIAALTGGASALDAIEAGIRVVEADLSVRTVGRGAWPNILGVVQLDAAMMDGSRLRSGAVGALEACPHPISIARAVLERLPHEILVGAGAARFAREIGAELADLSTTETRDAWRAMLGRQGLSADSLAGTPEYPLTRLARQAMDPEYVRDTTVFLACDKAGAIATGASTSGWAWKYPGRLGDTPIIGAGSYADSRYGACACTHTGEMAIRAGTARSVVLYMKMGLSLSDAVNEAAQDLRALRGGQLGPVVIHAIDAHGAHVVRAVGSTEPVYYWLWHSDDPTPTRLAAQTDPP